MSKAADPKQTRPADSVVPPEKKSTGGGKPEPTGAPPPHRPPNALGPFIPEGAE
jgi:hypothetical protein